MIHLSVSKVFFLELILNFPAFCVEIRLAESESVLDPNGELLLKWRVDYLAQRVQFEIIISEKAPEFNWFALGFSDRGELKNADVCLLWTDYRGQDHFQASEFEKSYNNNVLNYCTYISYELLIKKD